MRTHKTRKAPTKGQKPPTRKEGLASAKAKMGRQKGTPAPSAAIKQEMEKAKPAKARKRERLTRREEQAILMRLSRGESLGEVQKRFKEGVRDEISNLKKAFEAGEFEFKAGVYQLVS